MFISLPKVALMLRSFFLGGPLKEADFRSVTLAERIKKAVKVEEGSFLILSSCQTKTDKSVWFTDKGLSVKKRSFFFKHITFFKKHF